MDITKTVVLEYEPNWTALIWAKKNCPSYITNEYYPKSDSYYIRYHFSDDRDATLFALKWL